jgi:hypothetical protein
MKRTLIVFWAVATAYAQRANDPVLQRVGVTDLPVIHAQKGFSTLIEFPADQKVLQVTCGDKEFWVVEGTGRFLHVKPAKEGIVTNLNVVMEGDIVYAFILKEISGTGGVTARADLQVTINPVKDLALAASLEESERLRGSLTQSQRALAELNQKYQTEKDKNASCGPAPHAAKPKAKVKAKGQSGAGASASQ